MQHLIQRSLVGRLPVTDKDKLAALMGTSKWVPVQTRNKPMRWVRSSLRGRTMDWEVTRT